MAISIEQNNSSVNWFNIIVAGIIVIVVFAGTYFLFFKKPELIEVVAPGQFGNITEISKVDFKPQELLQSPEFKVLRQFESTASFPEPGRSNPFSPY